MLSFLIFYLVNLWRHFGYVCIVANSTTQSGRGGGNMGSRPLGPKEIDGLLVSPGKACSLLTDHLITG